ncbi:MAG: GNAT family N-acetyltransferase [Gammaproteobacteria bacterium]
MASAHDNLLAELRLTLRAGTHEDIAALHGLIGGIRKSYGLSLPRTARDDDLLDVERWYGSRRGMFAVLEDRSGVLVGCCGAYAGETPKTCVLRRLYVAYKMRHRGLGQLLMEHALDWARAQGFESVDLSVDQVFREGIRMYEKYGFVRHVHVGEHGAAACDLHFSLRV